MIILGSELPATYLSQITSILPAVQAIAGAGGERPRHARLIWAGRLQHACAER